MKELNCLTLALKRAFTCLLLLFLVLPAKTQVTFDYHLPGFYETSINFTSLGVSSDNGYHYTTQFQVSPFQGEGTNVTFKDKLNQHELFSGRFTGGNLPQNYHWYGYNSVLEKNDSSFWVAGEFRSFGAQNSSVPPQPYFEFLDGGSQLGGYESWFNRGANGRFKSIQSMTGHPSGGFSIVGEVYPDSMLQGRGAFFARIGPAPAHAVIWTRYYTNPENPFLRDVAALADGGMILASTHDSTGSHLMVTDSLGFKKWSYRLRNLTLLAVAEGKGNEVFFSGTTGTDAIVGSFDQVGTLNWVYRYGGPATGPFHDIAVCPDGSLIAANSEGLQRSLVKINAAGSVQWSRLYPNGAAPNQGFWWERRGKEVACMPDGGFLLGSESTFYDPVFQQPTAVLGVLRADSLGRSCHDSLISLSNQAYALLVQSIADTVITDSGFARVSIVPPTWSARFWDPPRPGTLCSNSPCNLQASISPTRDTLCVGDTLQLRNGLPQGPNQVVSWTNLPYPGFGTFSWGSGDSLDLEVTAAQTFTIFLTIEDTVTCCRAWDSVVVVVQEPVVFDLGMDYQICAPGMESLSGPPGMSSYLWSTGGTARNDSFAAPGWVWLEVRNAGACVSRDSLKVTLDSLKPNIQPDTVLCLGTPLQMDAGAGGTFYRWGHGPGQGYYASQSAPGIAGNTYTVSMTTPNGCVFGDTATIGAFPSQVPVLPDTQLCEADTLYLTAGSYASYLWSNGDTVAQTAYPQAGTYSLAVTDTFGCSFADTFTFSEIPYLLIDIGSDTAVCPGDSLFITPGFGLPQYQWSNGDTTFGTYVSSPGSYSLTVNDFQGCPTSDTLQLIWFPVSPPVVNDTIICAYDTLSLNLSGPYTSYVWSNGSTNAQAAFAQMGQYWLEVVDSFGCTQSDTFSLAWHPVLLPLIGDTSFCSGDSLFLSLNRPYSGYLWSTGSVNSSTVVSSGGWYSVAVTDSFGCEAGDSAFVEEFLLPQPYLGPDTLLCMGDSLRLETVGTYVSYLWGNGGVDPFIFVQNPGSYVLTVSDSNACTGRDTILIGAAPNPTAAFNFSALGTTVQFNNLSTGMISNLWHFGDGDSSVVSNPTHVYPAGSFTACLVVTNANGCQDSICQSLLLTSIFGALNPAITIAPNPTRDWIKIASPELPIEEWALYDLQGKLLRSNEKVRTRELQLDLSALPNAQYLLKVRRGESWMAKRIRIQR